MSDYQIEQVYQSDKKTLAEVKSLLEQEDITLDGNLDYTCVMRDADDRVIATGSCFHNTLRCFAVSNEHQGEGLLNEIITHLMQYEADKGNLHLFIYTKIQSAKYFEDLGFYEIARVTNTLVFMENRKNGFSGCLKKWEQETTEAINRKVFESLSDSVKKDAVDSDRITDAILVTDKSDENHYDTKLPASTAIVMNANPFTNGHRYLVEQAAKDGTPLHLFVVSEDASVVPFAVRKKLIEEGTKEFTNIVIHDSGPYIISSATFPSYFLKDETSVITGQACLDLAVFSRIAKALNITKRFVGEEKFSRVTALYNEIMQAELPLKGVRVQAVARTEESGVPVSASNVRRLIKNGMIEKIKNLVPASTYDFFRSKEGEVLIQKIKEAEEVEHY